MFSYEKKKTRRRRYSVETNTDPDVADDLALHTNTSVQAESQLNSLEQTARGISLEVNSDRTNLMCIKQRVISTLNERL